MTLAQQAQATLKRAEICKRRKKKADPIYREATLTVARILARENQKNGHHYSLQTLRAIRPAPKAKPFHSFNHGRRLMASKG